MTIHRNGSLVDHGLEARDIVGEACCDPRDPHLTDAVRIERSNRNGSQSKGPSSEFYKCSRRKTDSQYGDDEPLTNDLMSSQDGDLSSPGFDGLLNQVSRMKTDPSAHDNANISSLEAEGATASDNEACRSTNYHAHDLQHSKGSHDLRLHYPFVWMIPQSHELDHKASELKSPPKDTKCPESWPNVPRSRDSNNAQKTSDRGISSQRSSGTL